MRVSRQKPLSPRQELLGIQQKIFKRNNAFIRKHTFIRQGEFDAYERAYKRQVAHYEGLSGIDEVLEAIDKADLIYVGDYHTNHQSQKFFLRLLRLVVQRSSEMAIALELFQKRHQKLLRDYLEETIDEEEFLYKTQFKKYWDVSLWDNFKLLFDFARYHQLPIIGIEAVTDIMARLRHRDKKSAQVIVRFVKKNPRKKLLILVGDLHIAPTHLPAEVQKCLKKEGLAKRDLIIYQNSESIYWKLAEKNLEQKVEVVRINERSFCFMNTPPIIWQQSYIHWIENEGEGIDYHDAKQSFMDLVERIAEFLDLPLSKNSDEVEVFTSDDLTFLERLKSNELFSVHEVRLIKKQILNSESYFIPKARYVYLSDLSINHAAEEAAHYIKFLFSGEEFERDLVDAFYANLLNECLGFFGSKIINHKRKCFHQKDYKDLINYFKTSKVTKDRELEWQAAHLILEHYDMAKRGRPITNRRILKSDPQLFFAVTHGLGYGLGDRLYYGFINKVISKAEIRELFCDPFREEGVSFKVFLGLSRALRKVKIPARI
ncbi:MAG: hypothetical protein A2053_06280 [Deltaproteobacteria bacterium GWA2_50_8]|nr:MAG: hypothetical protein A2053_06280 [Deltaproteobacteria bacterium GWA2_50_8]